MKKKKISWIFACYFIGEIERDAINVWKASGWNTQLALWRLIDKCLVERFQSDPMWYFHCLHNISSEKKCVLRMHDHLRDLGQEMADELCHPRCLWRFEHLQPLISKGLANIFTKSQARCLVQLRPNSKKTPYELINASHSKTPIILVGTLGGAAFIAVLWLLFIFRHSFRKMYTKVPDRSQDEEAEANFAAEEDPKGDHQFNYDSLRAATNNFDQNMKLGEGGFGKVYKGIFRDGHEIAVKKLLVQQSTSAIDEFVTEVKLISAVRHRNLVRLLGCCRRGAERLLIYEFIPNTSLDRHIFANASKPLSWKTRFEIILGTAHGLAYLNEESPFRILHRDIKASNILLSNDFQPKIADFGLAKLFPDDLTHLTTRVGGTIGYTAPEYAVHGHLTEKIDVYSYGMLVLEIVSGRKYTDPKLPAQMELLLGWAWSLYEKNEAFSLVDPKLIESDPEVNKEEILKVIQIALLCTQGAPELRPLMSKVVSMLTRNIDILAQPTRPAFIENNYNSNGVDSVNPGWVESPSIASTKASLSISLEAR